uniref:Peptidase S1 domain-containing protein n=1 Tax=Timema tahoe TaxID=61484 RepID=A0A7R9IHE2_9NEOP|nr:unnamed protein product [Timema tahoe]
MSSDYRLVGSVDDHVWFQIEGYVGQPGRAVPSHEAEEYYNRFIVTGVFSDDEKLQFINSSVSIHFANAIRIASGYERVVITTPLLPSLHMHLNLLRSRPLSTEHSVLANQSVASICRKLFGGYRIVPKPCRGRNSGDGICMFNYECTQRNGEVEGACMDGFLFGACCRLPDGITFELPDQDLEYEHIQGEINNVLSSDNRLSSANNQNYSSYITKPQSSNNILKPFNHIQLNPQADTILLHQNGSVVSDDHDPEHLFKPSLIHRNNTSYGEGETILIHPTTRPGIELSTFSYVTGPNGYSTSTDSKSTLTNIVAVDSDVSDVSDSNKLELDSHTPEGLHTSTHKLPSTEGKHTTFYSMDTSSRPYPIGSTLSRPFFPDSTSMNEIEDEKLATKPLTSITPNYYSTRWPSNRPTPGFRPRPSTPGTKDKIIPTSSSTNSHGITDQDTDEGLVLVPTITVHYGHTKEPPVPEPEMYPESNSESINHIISMLGDGEVGGVIDPGPEPFPSTEVPNTHPGLSTWGYIDGKPSSSWGLLGTYKPSSTPSYSTNFFNKKPSTATIYFTPPKRPLYSTSTSILSGPSFSVTENVNKPAQHGEMESSSKPTRPNQVPTVIVLGPMSSDYTTSRPYNHYSSSGDKYSGTIITKRPQTHTSKPPSSLSWVQTSVTNTRPTSWDDDKIATKPTYSEMVSLITRRPTLSSLTTKKPSSFIVTKRPLTTDPTTVQDLYVEENYQTSGNDLVNFPPVRNPQLNMTGSSQQENPSVVQSTDYTVIEGNYPEDNIVLENDIATPAFTEDDKLNNKLQGFVSKIVGSLQGNFQELEDVVFKTNNNSFSSTIGIPLASRPPSTTKKPTSGVRPTPSRRPISSSPITTTKNPTRLSTSSARPSTPTRRPIKLSTSSKRPATSQTPKPIASQSQRPSVTTKPVNNQSQRPSTRPRPTSTTKRPTPPRRTPIPSSTSSISTTTRGPRPTYTSKRPRPTTKRSTTTSSTTQLIQVDDEEELQEISTKPVISTSTTEASTTASTTPKPVDYKRGQVLATHCEFTNKQLGECLGQVLATHCESTNKQLGECLRQVLATHCEFTNKQLGECLGQVLATHCEFTIKQLGECLGEVLATHCEFTIRQLGECLGPVLATHCESITRQLGECLGPVLATHCESTTRQLGECLGQVLATHCEFTTRQLGECLGQVLATHCEFTTRQLECGVRPLMHKNGRIVGGKGATFGEWPWQVLVRESTWLGLFTKNKCGGVLITSKFVVTAAHCQPGFLANLVAVFGEFDISGELESKRSITKNVKRVIVHRHYDAATFANDLALLELESPVSFDTHIVPICMPKDNEDFTGRMATVTGWGRLKYGGGVPSVLQEVQVPIIENPVCQEMFQTAGHAKTILSSFLCAGYANGQKDSCEVR